MSLRALTPYTSWAMLLFTEPDSSATGRATVTLLEAPFATELLEISGRSIKRASGLAARTKPSLSSCARMVTRVAKTCSASAAASSAGDGGGLALLTDCAELSATNARDGNVRARMLIIEWFCVDLSLRCTSRQGVA